VPGGNLGRSPSRLGQLRITAKKRPDRVVDRSCIGRPGLNLGGEGRSQRHPYGKGARGRSRVLSRDQRVGAMNDRKRGRAGKRASASREGHELTGRRPRHEDGGRGEQKDPIDASASHPAPGQGRVAIDLTCEEFHGSPPNLTGDPSLVRTPRNRVAVGPHRGRRRARRSRRREDRRSVRADRRLL
jgi:hypothetical protein